MSQYNTFLGSNNINIMTLDEQYAYIGINNSNPLYPLHVNGNTNINGTLYSSTHSNSGNLQIGSNLILAQTNIYGNNHNLAINNSNPSFPLDVNGTIRGNSNLYLGSTVFLPPSNMTSNTLVYNGITYTSSASSWNGTFPWAAFQSGDYSGWISGSGLYNSSGSYTGLTSSTFSGSNFNGEWLQFQSTSNIPLTSYFLETDANSSFFSGMPTSFVLGGSSDGSNWNLIDSQTNFSWTQYYSTSCNTYNLNNVYNYNYLRLVSLSNNGSKSFVCIGLFYPIIFVSTSSNTLMSGRIFSSTLSNSGDVYIGGNANISGALTVSTLSNSSLINTSNCSFFASNLSITSSNTLYPQSFYASNLSYNTSNDLYPKSIYASNLSITSSNTLYPQSFYASNLAVSSSNDLYPKSSYASNVAYSLSNGFVSLANPGYVAIPGGVLMQWGSVQFSQSSTQVSGWITFPTTFSSTPYSVTATLYDINPGYTTFANSGQKSCSVMISTLVPTQCYWSVKAQATYSSSNTFMWIAIGPK